MQSKLPDIGTTIFTKMSALAVENNAINLSQGFPNFSIDEQLKNYVLEALQKEQVQYAPMAGRLDLRESISKQIKKKYNISINPETEITITAGATQGIFTAISTLISPGDEVILFDPAYDCYDPAIRAFGGKPIHINLTYPDFKIDWNKVYEKVNEKTKLIIINNPNNPATSLLDINDIKHFETLAVKYPKLNFISDEVYEYITYEKPHLSFLTSSLLKNKSWVVYSFGKTFHVTGWKVGYCIAPAELTTEFRKIHQFNVFCVNNTMQYALCQFMNQQNRFDEISSLYKNKRDLFLSRIQSSKFKPLPCAGTYFVLCNYSEVSDKNDLDFAIELAVKHKLASIPVSVFYHDNSDHKLLRFCIAKTDETIINAATILCKI